METIKQIRQVHDLTGKRLKRARYLFIYLCHRKMLAYGDDYMDLFVEKAKEYGFYSEKSDDRSVRFLALRRVYKIHNPDRLGWHQWYANYHWKGHTWKKNA